jgi:hypothetical protein
VCKRVFSGFHGKVGLAVQTLNPGSEKENEAIDKYPVPLDDNNQKASLSKANELTGSGTGA